MKQSKKIKTNNSKKIRYQSISASWEYFQKCHVRLIDLAVLVALVWLAKNFDVVDSSLLLHHYPVTLLWDFETQALQRSRTISIPPKYFHIVKNLEDHLEQHQLGPCNGKESIVYPFPPQLCSSNQCLWSKKWKKDIDISRYPFKSLDAGRKSLCPPPAGGQAWHSDHKSKQHDTVVVSFIVTVKDTMNESIASILQLFKVSREVDSAELIVVDDGSKSDFYPLATFLKDLQTLFGFRVKVIRNGFSKGVYFIVIFVPIHVSGCCFLFQILLLIDTRNTNRRLWGI